MIVEVFSGQMQNRQAEIQKLVLGVLEEHGFEYDPKKDSDLEDIEGYYLQGKGSGVFYTGMVDGEIVGTSAVRQVDDKRCEIKRIYVKKEYRGKGYGKKLFLCALEFAKENYHVIELKTDSTLDIAIGMYLKYGFFVVREDEEAGIVYMRRSPIIDEFGNPVAQKQISEREIKLLEKGLEMGKLKFKSREELHERRNISDR
ncbi:MAG: GNAT family N-acetyltransferase [Methanosarcinales archaeon]|nr:GNAT family N-acetyltransferase [Methanosarcinales archaeon]